MRRLKFYLDCVCVDLFVINITQRLPQSVQCKVACVVREALQCAVGRPGRHQPSEGRESRHTQPGGDSTTGGQGEDSEETLSCE